MVCGSCRIWVLRGPELVPPKLMVSKGNSDVSSCRLLFSAPLTRRQDPHLLVGSRISRTLHKQPCFPVGRLERLVHDSKFQSRANEGTEMGLAGDHHGTSSFGLQIAGVPNFRQSNCKEDTSFEPDPAVYFRRARRHLPAVLPPTLSVPLTCPTAGSVRSDCLSSKYRAVDKGRILFGSFSPSDWNSSPRSETTEWAFRSGPKRSG